MVFDLALWVSSHVTLTALVGVWNSSEHIAAYGTPITELAFDHMALVLDRGWYG